MPSVRFCARPSGNTSTSLAVKSVSRAEVAAYNTTRTGPMTSTSLRRGAVVYTSTSRRCSTARWSFGPQGNTFGLQQAAPPAVGDDAAGAGVIFPGTAYHGSDPAAEGSQQYLGFMSNGRV